MSEDEEHDHRDMPPPDTPGPLDSFANRELLDARVVRSLDGRVELHGLDVVSDLSHHYSFAEVILTSLTGEPPTEHVGELFETCCHFAAPVSVAEAPAHVSRLCETIGTDPAGQVATVACALSEQVSHHMSRLEGFLQWLREPDGDPPEVAFDDDGSPAPLAEAFYERVRAIEIEVPGLLEKSAFWSQLFASLHRCGLDEPRAMTAALVTARLPIAASEGMMGESGQLADYPANLPRVRYEHEEGCNERS